MMDVVLFGAPIFENISMKKKVPESIVAAARPSRIVAIDRRMFK